MGPTVSLAPEGVPALLREQRQWVVWRSEDTERGATKVPYRPHHPSMRASTRDPDHWSDFATAAQVAAVEPDVAGVGFVLTEADPFVGIDLDGVIDPETGAVAPLAARAIRRIDTYTETSPSGTGVHLILQGSLGSLVGRKHGPVEIYEEGRYLTVTGAVLGGRDRIRPRQEALEAFHAFAFPQRTSVAPGDRERGAASPVGHDEASQWSDYELLERMFASRHGDAIEALYGGDTSGYPSHSEADLALAAHLAWWTDYDRERADRLFRGSGLYRHKWDERHYSDGRTYGQATLDTAFTES